jgi:hypothetical protein
MTVRPTGQAVPREDAGRPGCAVQEKVVLKTTTLLVLGAALLGAVLASCGRLPEPPPPAYTGTITSGCAPHDAPSTVLQLQSEEGVQVSFNLWPPSGLALPTTVVFGSQYAPGQGTYCASPEDCEDAVRGRVALAGAPDSDDVTGEWELQMEDGTVHRGRFTAEWLAIQALCG